MLVWVERGRARTLMKQLGGGDGRYSAMLKEELFEFDNNYQAAERSIRSCQLACKGDALFVEYYCTTSDLPSYNGVRIIALFLYKNVSYSITLQTLHGGSIGNEVKTLVDRFCESIIKSRTQASVVVELHNILENLFELLVEPILSLPLFKGLESNPMLIFVPDKTLYRVPFSLLRDKRSGKFLFQLHTVAISPSLRVLQHCEQRWRDLQTYPLRPSTCILAVGNASYETHRRLPGTGKELEYLKEKFPGLVETLQEGQATRVNFLQLVQQASLSKEQHVFACIHLGVHGLWSKTDDMNMFEEKNQFATGCLQFAKPHKERIHDDDISEGNRGVSHPSDVAPIQPSVHTAQDLVKDAQDSGNRGTPPRSFGEIGVLVRGDNESMSSASEDMLPSEDIVTAGFQWRTPLVVLSACNSLRGQDYCDGEVNLPRALMIAGVPAAVVSQWKVDDSASPRLMEAFYSNLKCGQNVGRALQSAMIQLSATTSEDAHNIFAWGRFPGLGFTHSSTSQELWTENARKVDHAREQAELLKTKLNELDFKNDQESKQVLFRHLEAVDHFLDYVASGNTLALEDEVIKISAVVGVEELLSKLRCIHFRKFNVLNVVSKLAEQFYTVLLPLEELTTAELELEKRCDESFMIRFWAHMMHTQALKGKLEIALKYCSKLEQVSNLESPDRPVILGMMGKLEEAFQGFDEYVSQVKTYEGLVQTSYLSHQLKDEVGAMVYALQAKRMGKVRADEPSYGELGSLLIKTLPVEDTFCRWFANVDESSITKSIVNALATKERLLSLRRKFTKIIEEEVRTMYLNGLKPLERFVALVYGSCKLEESVIVDAIFTIEDLASLSRDVDLIHDVIALIKGFYTMLTFDHSNWIDLTFSSWSELISQRQRGLNSAVFRSHILFVLAMNGDLQTALNYADKMVEAIHSANSPGSEEFYVRQERAAVLRLMGRNDEALEELEALLEIENDFECLIQCSCIKLLRGDDSGALEYALRAKDAARPGMLSAGYGAFMLSSFKSLPDGHRTWLLTQLRSTSQPPTETSTHKSRAMPPKPIYTANCSCLCEPKWTLSEL